jgi:GT2 family glycosyltransferase
MKSPDDTSLAVLLTCHNRRETTLRSLDTLFSQKNINKFEISVFLVDDGSTDGTAEEVSEQYPEINILEGNGSLYWTGGIRKAMAAALEVGFDFYLWLNDDTVLFPNALKKLIDTFYKKKQEGVGTVVGSLCDPDTGEWTYGASVRSSWWHPLRFKPIFSQDIILEADNFWGNVVLIPEEVVQRVGNLDNKLIHGAGDHDYALRTKNAGFQIWVVPDYIGECPRNTIENTWKDSNLSLLERFKKILSVKERPIRNRFYYLKKHGGILFFVIFFSPYVQLLIDHVCTSLFNMESRFSKHPFS